MYVIGTAGHIDHGKSTLVKALTGIDPDRLPEEKDRGMTIDLGFAWLRLPSGREVSIVDVPGHERFIKNMLAGVGGIDLALLVIAADEGIMPQTEEHLAILELLRVRRAVVALTKRDLVEEDWLELVRSDVAERLARSSLGDVPIVAVSATTRDGLPELLDALDRALDGTPPKPNRGRPRLPIDRVFTISGFGTVVTGTLIDGQIEVGQELEVLPGAIRTRARGIQTHKHKVERAAPGARVAVNLVGVAVDQLGRGQVLTRPGWLRPTRLVDAHLQVLPGAPAVPHNAPVSFHTGSAEMMARVRLLGEDVARPGTDVWAQLQLAGPVAVAKGDLFVIRSPNETLGGGEIVEPHPKRHRHSEVQVVRKLEVLEKGTPDELVVQALDGRFGSDLAGLIEKTALPPDEVRAAVGDLAAAERVVRLGDYVVARPALDNARASIEAELGEFHRRYPLRPGMSREELRSRLRLPAREAAALFDHLTTAGAIVVEDSVVRLPGHTVAFTPAQEARIRELLDELAAQPFSPPSLEDLAGRLELDEEVLAVLVARGKIVRVSEAIAFTADAFAEIRRRVVERLGASGAITVSEVRDMLDTTRKYALALMEYFDQQRLTRRVGDARVLR